jgi:hypothetical protein
MSSSVHGGEYLLCFYSTLASNAAKLKFALVRTKITSNLMVFLTAEINAAVWN